MPEVNVRNQHELHIFSVANSVLVVAALLFGDVLHNGGQVYNILSGAAYSSSNPRLGDSLTNLNKFSAVLRSYCQEPDPVCAAAGPGPFDVNDHLNYFDLVSLAVAHHCISTGHAEFATALLAYIS